MASLVQTIISALIIGLVLFIIISLVQMLWNYSSSLTGLAHGSKSQTIPASSMGGGQHGTNSTYSIWFYLDGVPSKSSVLLQRSTKGTDSSPKITLGPGNSLSIEMASYSKGDGGHTREGFDVDESIQSGTVKSASPKAVCVKGATSQHSNVIGIYKDLELGTRTPVFYNSISRLYLYHVPSPDGRTAGIWCLSPTHTANLKSSSILMTCEGAPGGLPALGKWKLANGDIESLAINTCDGSCGSCGCTDIAGFSAIDSLCVSSNALEHRSTSSAEQCRKMCVSNDKCTGFVFNKGGHSDLNCGLLYGSPETWKDNGGSDCAGSCVYKAMSEGFSEGFSNYSPSTSSRQSRISDGAQPSGHRSAPSGSGGSSGGTNCSLKNIPVQKWVNLVVSTFGNQLDVYINGKLSKTCLMNGSPKHGGAGDIFITPGGGFKGWTARAQYMDHDSTPEEVYEIYRNGFGYIGQLSSYLSDYRVRFALMHDGSEEGAFEI